MNAFCTPTGSGNFSSSVDHRRCHLDLVNTAIFAGYAYITVLILVYLRCSRKQQVLSVDYQFVCHSLRCLLSLLLLFVHLLELSAALLWDLALLSSGSALVAWPTAQLLYRRAEVCREPRYLLVTSAFWLACGLARASLFYSALDLGLRELHVIPLTAGAVSLLCHALVLSDVVTVICELKTLKQDGLETSIRKESYVYRHHSVSWYSRVTFAWLTPLLKLGHSQPLELSDLGTLPLRETAATQIHAFKIIYLQHKDNLWWCYTQCYWHNFAVGGLLKLLGDCVGFVPPLGISVIIQYVSMQNQVTDNIDVREMTLTTLLSNGYVMAGLVLVSSLAQGTLSQASTHVVNVEGIRLKTALQALVYQKALKLSGLGKEDESTQESRSGNLTNLMSEDTFNIMSCYWIGHYVWAIPLKIGILMYLLYCKLGVSAILGATFCILILTPLQFYIGKKMSSNSKQISDWSDERLRQTNEVLQGVRLLKLCGWETDFSDRILSTRNKELEALDRDSLYWALMTFLTHASSALITLVTLGMFYVLEGSSLSAADVFSGLALFNQLTVPLFIFPITVPIIISAVVSTRRLKEFLDLPEMQSVLPTDEPQQLKIVLKPEPAPDVIDSINRQSRTDSVFGLGNITECEEPEEDCSDNGSDTDKYLSAVTVEAAVFSWSASADEPTLAISSLHLPKGKLTIIVGNTGSGKSTLLSSLLGEIHRAKGVVKWTRGSSVAYVSQKPWLLNSSLRDNILFGRPYHPQRYARVISSTALQPDIDILPGKDMTDIGERGINLSGGQRQRVAIARALYAKANVVIMDDPLSALDQQVAQQVFEDGIKRLVVKQKRTVILVTQNIQLIPHAHQVVLMEKGGVKACGSPLELERNGVSVMGHSLEEAHKGRTARERWQLVKLVSRIGLQLKQRNLADGSWRADHIMPSIFVPFKRRLSKFSGSRYFTHDLPLPTDECEAEEMVERRRRTASTASLPPLRHRAVARTTSLQTGPVPPLYPVKRQSSSPTINRPRARMFTFDSALTTGSSGVERSGSVKSGNLLRQIFSVSTQRNLSSAVPEAPVREHSVLRRLISTASVKSAVGEGDRPPLKRLPSTTSNCSDDFLDDEDAIDSADWGPAHSQEEREYGQIERRIYLSYLQACGVTMGATYLVTTVSWQGLRIYTDYWLTEWTNDDASQALYYLAMYGVLSAASIVLSVLTNGLGQYCGAKARRRLHNSMLQGLLACPVKFFETMPLGRIMNRFSTDLSVIDKKIATSLQRLLQFLLLCFSAILVNCIVTPWFIALAVPICLIYYIVQKFYRSSTRELQRLDSMTRTPILSHFTETLSGVETIRAFNQQQRFTLALFHKLDTHTNTFLIVNSCNRWLGIALDYLGGLIVFLAMLVSLVSAAVLPDLVSPALVGLAINYTLLVPIYLNWVVKFLADMEMYMGAVERVTHFAEAPAEDYRLTRYVPPLWPKTGDLKFKNVTLQYDVSREPVIANLNLHIPSGQKVGICGRTGSGKSSLVMSLFHMVSMTEGAILIDDTDISSIPLKVLRSRLSVIPQDIIMFSGSIRENLDVRGEFSDTELWQSLEIAQMKEAVTCHLGGLDGVVKEGGENLSCGQRQLLCLARAVLHKAALLVMDEATSSLDQTTERKLLEVAAHAFADRTVITIAHRLSGLLGCDRILVLEAGRIVEDGTPAQLLSQRMGIFSTMLRAGEEPS